MSQSMVGKHAMWPKENDVIFSISGRAQAAEKALGMDNVINATIGALMDDSGKLITMKTVYEEYKALDNCEIGAYAALEGQPDYLEAVKKYFQRLLTRRTYKSISFTRRKWCNKISCMELY